jgi:TRAP-type C4-dicarboxylate transport system permease small subunit
MLKARLQRAAELVSAALFALMFCAFMIQIVSRYCSTTRSVVARAVLAVLHLAGVLVVGPPDGGASAHPL